MSESKTISDVERLQLSYSYAALLLTDVEQEITAEQLERIVKVSGNKSNKTWATNFAKALKGKDLSKILTCGGGGSGQVASGPVEPAKQAGKVEAPQKEKEPSEEEDFGGFDMFG